MCVSSWQNVVPGTSNAAGTTTESVLSTLEGINTFVFLWTDFVAAITKLNRWVIEIKMKADFENSCGMTIEFE